MTRTSLKIHCGRLDPVPIIDLFFLLLIFTLIGSSLVFHPGIQVQLPKAPSSELRGVPKLVVTITRPRRPPAANDGAGNPGNADQQGTGNGVATNASEDLLFFNDTRVEWEDFEQHVRREVHDRRLTMARTATREEKESGSRSMPLLVLRADRGVAYERIIEVLSMGRSLGLGVYLVTAPGSDRVSPPGGASVPPEAFAP
jgi:biopolymer transport protein ExbD